MDVERSEQHEAGIRAPGSPLDRRRRNLINSGRLLSVDEAADYLGISSGTLRNWLSMRRLAYVKIGRLTKLSLDTLDRHIAEHTVEAVTEQGVR